MEPVHQGIEVGISTQRTLRHHIDIPGHAVLFEHFAFAGREGADPPVLLVVVAPGRDLISMRPSLRGERRG